jgi:Family of unknown function (DUF6493)
MTIALAPELARAIDKRSIEQVYAYLTAAPEKDRKAAFPAVVAYTKDELMDWRDGIDAVAGLALLGCAPTAKRAMSAINRGSLRWNRRLIPRQSTIDLLVHRNVPWLAELAHLWAGTSPLQTAEEWLLVDGIAGAAGIEPPRTEGFTRGWIAWIRSEKDPYKAITTGSYAYTLLPLLFEYERMGRDLGSTYFGTGFNSSLQQLAANNPDIRTMLIQGCLARLLRGGRPGDLRSFVTLHDELALTPAEIGALIPDYVGLITAELGTVAGMAQRCLRQADQAGLLEVDTLLAITGIVLRRKEKGLTKTQATWVRQAAKRYPGRASELLALLDVPTGPELLPLSAPIAPIVPDMPAPITTATELAEELAALVEGDRSVATMERVLAAVVELHGRDRETLRSAIRPVVENYRDRLINRWVRGYWARLGTMLFGLLEPPPLGPMRLIEAFGELHADHIAQLLRDSELSPSALMEVRLATIERYIRHSPVPRLVATPTQRNGHVDPAVLVDRLERAERDGWQPWHADLTQALLRLPREDPGPDVHRRAERLASPGGRVVARRLRQGHRDPIITAYIQYGKGGRYRWLAPLPDRRVAVAMDPPTNADPTEAALFTLPKHEQPQAFPWISNRQLWAGALPSHREVVAAWALARLAMAADSKNGGGDAAQILPLLAENHGPTGPATQLALVYGMTAPDTADRVATLDALLGFANAVDWGAVGRHLGDCVSADSLVLTRAAGTLRDAAEAGAVDTAWQICVAALPSLLAAPKPRPGVADILQLTRRCTQTLGRRGHIEGLQAVASRGGSSQYVAAARDLHDALATIP